MFAPLEKEHFKQFIGPVLSCPEHKNNWTTTSSEMQWVSLVLQGNNLGKIFLMSEIHPMRKEDSCMLGIFLKSKSSFWSSHTSPWSYKECKTSLLKIIWLVKLRTIISEGWRSTCWNCIFKDGNWLTEGKRPRWHSKL